MTRTERLLRLARQRGDLLAVATLETAAHLRSRTQIVMRLYAPHCTRCIRPVPYIHWTEAELREAWGR